MIFGVGVRHTVDILHLFALTFPFAFAFLAVLVSDSIVFDHVFIDFCLKFMDHHLHLCPFKVKLC